MKERDDMTWNDKTVLITGGTGSFGRKLTSLLLAEYQPKKIIIFSRDEMKQFTMRAEGFDAGNIRYFIGDVRDKERLYRAFYEVDVVIHAAAIKQVPTSEYNPFETIKTNVIGAANVIDAAIDCGVERVIALSTDKAAHPINLYGASKLCADKLFVAGNAYAGARKTCMSVVRYGNVAGSRGSVIPYFWEQRKRGKLTVTDKRMTRFLITLEQGARFVVHCVERMHGGEIFVPKIPSIRICDLAHTIAPECSVEIVGIRPGEKLHEVMVPRDDARHTVELEDFFVVQPDFQWWDTKNWKSGEPCSDSFEYASNTNSEWLGYDAIRALIAGLELEGHSGKCEQRDGHDVRVMAAAR
ncbi:MAG TPA: UDP-N-acetylglucosamine 4,6-dehydratase (inverting) [Candidatus Acidoferrales bacterium]|nr:UDP-N-acetylglucosamine 4,6-dehydratase (inverting) [Candidatus Acidoferrales bacterium]